MANVGSLRTTISLDSAQFQQGMAGVNRQLKSLKQEQKAVTSSGTGFARGLTEMRSKADVLSRTFEVQQGKVQELKRRYDEAKTSTNENSKETQKAQEEYNKAVSEMNKTENQLKNLTAEIERQANPWNRLSKEMDDTGKKMQDVGRGMTDFGKNWSMRVTAPVLGLAGAALKVGMDFEQGMSKVQAISGATGGELETLSDQAKELGGTTRFSATEAASGMEFLAMAGFETNEVLEAMPGLLDLAASSNMELARAADIASNIISGFGYEANETGRVADVLAKGASSANTNVAQLGDAMATVAPVASALGLDVEELTGAVGMMSDAGIQGSQSGRMLRQGLLRLSAPTGEASDLIDELGINVFDADGNMKDLHNVVGELEGGLDGMSAQAQTAALSTIFGSESTAGWTALLERGGDELEDYTGELENAEGAASDMADTMQDNAKGKIVEFQSALEGIGIALSEHMIPMVTDAVEWGTELVRNFGELDEETQKNIVQMGLFAAAIGPAAIVAGSLTTAIGGVVKIGGGLVGLLGKVGGAGLLGRVGLLGMSGPVGWGVAGLTALGGIIYAVTRDTEELNDVNFEAVKQMEEETLAIDELINQFESMQKANKLTKDEMLEYMDILAELEQTSSPDKIEELTKRQNELLEESGFTNKEMQTFLDLNDDVIEKAPNTAKAISSEGEAYAENTEALRDLNEEKRKEMMMTARSELIKGLENERDLILEKNELIKEQREIDRDISKLYDDRIETTQTVKSEQEKLNGLQNELKSMEKDSVNIGTEKWEQKKEEVRQQEIALSLAQGEHSEVENTIEDLETKFFANQDNLESVRDQLKEIGDMQLEYERLILSEFDLNAERGKGIEALDDEISRLLEIRNGLDENSEGYQEQVNKINDQISGLRDAKGELDTINNLATRDVYSTRNSQIETTHRNLGDVKTRASDINTLLGKDIDKDVDVDDNGTVDDLNKEATKKGFKDVDVSLARRNNIWDLIPRSVDVGINLIGGALGFASGTDSHPGGTSWLGEEGPELVRHGNKWTMADFGLYNDVPRGAQVFTHDESKKILKSLNNIPGYATGISPSGEADRIASRLNQPQQVQGEAVIYTTVINQMDGRELSRHTYKHITEMQEMDRSIEESFR